MKLHPLNLFSLITAALLTFPALAAPPSTSPYYTDTASSFVEDQVSKDMGDLNMFLCLINAMAPHQMFNKGDYIAMVDMNSCISKAKDNNSNTSSVNYIFPTVNASRASNLQPMLTKIWVDDLTETVSVNGINETKKFDVRMYGSATKAPNRLAPYGVFRLDYCQEYADDPRFNLCSDHMGYINSTLSGLSFYSKDNKYDTSNGNYYEEFALQLSSSSTTSSGSGIIIKTSNNNSTGTPTTSAVVFANNADYFYRDDGKKLPDGSANKQCFDRSESKARESVWRYGLYNASTGARINRTSGFQVEYSSGGQTYYGYADKWGFNMPVDVPHGSTVTRQDYSTTPPTPLTYTVQRTGGKLTKYTQNFKLLSAINGPANRFQFSPYKDVYAGGTYTSGTYTSGGTKVMSAFNSYMIYWDDTAKQFYVHSVIDPSTYAWTQLSTSLAADNIGMQGSMTYYDSYYGTNTPYDLYGWSETVGSISIKKAALATLDTTKSSTTVFTTLASSTVYPSGFAAIGGLVCINDCLTAASLSSWTGQNNPAVRPLVDYYSTTYPYPTYTYQFTGTATAGTLTNTTTTTSVTVPAMSYTLDGATGNIVDSTSGQVIQSNSSLWGAWGNGRMASTADWAKIIASKCSGGTCTAATLSDSDIDLLANTTDSPSYSYSYYQWQTGPSLWDQLVYLIDNQTTFQVVFDSPLELRFTVPDAAKYGAYRNTDISLYYNEFGSLNGFPYYCVDMRSNDLAPCNYTNVSDYEFYRWVPQLSIPFDLTSGKVTVTGPAGDPLIGTEFLVKGLDKELRLQKVDVNICTVQQLGTNVTISKLPSASQWINPATNTGDKPVFNPIPAPKVIHGVVQ